MLVRLLQITKTRKRRQNGAHDHNHKQSIRLCFKLLMVGWALFVVVPAQAGSYLLPATGNNLVGKIQYIEARAQDTLLDIARKYDLGFNEITAANPGIDPWLPEQGARIVLPTRFILPQGPGKGIVVNIAEMRLYYFPEPKNGEAKKVITHPIGIGRQGWATPVGDYHIVMKIEKPSWTMPISVYQESLANGIKSRRLIPPGPDNPLGDFAMQLNADSLLIHGTNMPFSIGMRVSRGCLRLYPEDISSLVTKVPKGTPVRIVEQPYKFGYENNVLFMEAHEPVVTNKNGINLTPVISGVVRSGAGKLSSEEWEHIVSMAGQHTGVPVPIFQRTNSRYSAIMQSTVQKKSTSAKTAAVSFSSAAH